MFFISLGKTVSESTRSILRQLFYFFFCCCALGWCGERSGEFCKKNIIMSKFE